MAVKLESTIKRFIGKSTDQKPVVGRYFGDVLIQAKDLPPGSTFLEEDFFLADGSQRIARWNGEAWTYPLAPATQAISGATLEKLLKEITLLRLGMIEAGTCEDV